MSPAERFWSHVHKSDGCWIWSGARDRDGYGRISWDKRHTRAHRVAWLLTNGPIAPGKVIAHHCDNPPCANPAHLFIATIAENNADRVAKGRSSHVYPLRDQQEKVPRHEQHWKHKLTMQQVEEIRRRYGAGEFQRELAVEFKVSQSRISEIVNHLAWRAAPLAA